MRAKILLGCYRTGDANDPETYIAAITAALARYPEQIITSVTHPVSGLPSKTSWLPTIKEVVDACDAEYAPIANNEARLKRIKEQLEMRMADGRSYHETADQAALSAAFDMKLSYKKCRSFRHLVKVFGELTSAGGLALEEWPPIDWQETTT